MSEFKFMVSDFSRMIGRNVRLLRIDMGISQTKLAKRTRYSQSAIAQIESGSNAPSLKLLLRIASALNVGPYTLLKKIVVRIK